MLILNFFRRQVKKVLQTLMIVVSLVMTNKRFAEVAMEFGPVMSPKLAKTIQTLAIQGFDFKLEYKARDDRWSLRVDAEYVRVAYNLYRNL